jgi:hypothetical protein
MSARLRTQEKPGYYNGAPAKKARRAARENVVSA